MNDKSFRDLLGEMRHLSGELEEAGNLPPKEKMKSVKEKGGPLDLVVIKALTDGLHTFATDFYKAVDVDDLKTAEEYLYDIEKHVENLRRRLREAKEKIR